MKHCSLQARKVDAIWRPCPLQKIIVHSKLTKNHRRETMWISVCEEHGKNILMAVSEVITGQHGIQSALKKELQNFPI